VVGKNESEYIIVGYIGVEIKKIILGMILAFEDGNEVDWRRMELLC
jgi:hypothetical protein